MLESLERRTQTSATLTAYIIQTGDGTPFHVTRGPTRDLFASERNLSVGFDDGAGHVDPTTPGR